MENNRDVNVLDQSRDTQSDEEDEQKRSLQNHNHSQSSSTTGSSNGYRTIMKETVINSNVSQIQMIPHQNEDEGEEEEVRKIDLRLTVQQGSFLPFLNLVANGKLDPHSYVIDANTGGKGLHYAGHFGNLKALRAMIELYQVDPLIKLDYYKLTVAHYAARQGQLAILVYLSKYNQEILSMQDSFGYTPLHYTLMYNKVYCFIFLFCKLKLTFNLMTLNPTLMQMSSHNDCGDIAQILLHTPEYKQWITQTLFFSALQRQNYSITMLIVQQAYMDIPDQAWVLSFQFLTQQAGEPDVHKTNFLRQLTYYRFKAALESGKGLDSITVAQGQKTFTSGQKCCFRVMQAWKKCAPILSFILIFLINFWLVIASARSRRVDLLEEYNMRSYHRIDSWIIASMVSLIVSFLSCIKLRITTPGFLPKIELNNKSRQNILTKLSDDFEKHSVERLTPLDEICFICLQMKTPHVEHCKTCNQCVQTYHLHSEFLGTCVGSGNQHSYNLFLLSNFVLYFIALVQLILYSTIPGGENETQSSNWFLAAIEVHINALRHLNMAMLLPLIIGWVGLFAFADCVLNMAVAVSRGVTINELEQPWLYKYNFEVKKSGEEGQHGCRSQRCRHGHGHDSQRSSAMKKMLQKKQNQYKQKKVSLCQSLWNVVKFFFGCRVIEQIEQSQESPIHQKKQKEPTYIELAVLGNNNTARSDVPNQEKSESTSPGIIEEETEDDKV